MYAGLPVDNFVDWRIYWLSTCRLCVGFILDVIIRVGTKQVKKECFFVSGTLLPEQSGTL